MPDPNSDQSQTKRGIAVLATCIVQTMNESDPHFQDRFLDHLSKAYGELRDNSDNEEVEGMELLTWTRELLTGFSHAEGQQEPFLSKDKP